MNIMLEKVSELNDREGRLVLMHLVSYLEAATNQGHTIDKESFEFALKDGIDFVKTMLKNREEIPEIRDLGAK